MRGHWISGTRKLNRHYQSGGGAGGLDMVLWTDTCVPGNNIAGTKMPGTGLIGSIYVPRSRDDYAPTTGIKAAMVMVWKMDASNKYPSNATQSDIESKKDLLIGNPSSSRYYRGGLGFNGQPNVNINEGDEIVVVIKSKSNRYSMQTRPCFVYTMKAKSGGELLCSNFIKATLRSGTDPNLYFTYEMTHNNATGAKTLFDNMFDSSNWTGKKYSVLSNSLIEDENGVAAPTPGTMDLDGGDEAHMLFCKRNIVFTASVNVTWREIIDPSFIKGLQVIDVETVEK